MCLNLFVPCHFFFLYSFFFFKREKWQIVAVKKKKKENCSQNKNQLRNTKVGRGNDGSVSTFKIKNKTLKSSKIHGDHFCATFRLIFIVAKWNIDQGPCNLAWVLYSKWTIFFLSSLHWPWLIGCSELNELCYTQTFLSIYVYQCPIVIEHVLVKKAVIWVAAAKFKGSFGVLIETSRQL